MSLPLSAWTFRRGRSRPQQEHTTVDSVATILDRLQQPGCLQSTGRSRDDVTDVGIDAVTWVEVLTGLDDSLKFRGEGGKLSLTRPDVVELSVKEQ